MSDIDKNSEMRLCKYALKFEAWILSFVLSPLVILVFVAQYINWCMVKSLFRIGWMPLVAGGVYIICRYNLGVSTGSFVIMGMICISVIGVFSWLDGWVGLSDEAGEREYLVNNMWVLKWLK